MAAGNRTTIFYITDNSLTLARRLKEFYRNARIVKFRTDLVPDIWKENRNLIFIMAAGIVVRTIAPLVENKKTDPAVVVVDDLGRFAVSLLSGHIGGANELSKEVASVLEGEAVITTASDVNYLPPIDLWAEKNGLVIEDWKLLSRLATKLVNSGALSVYNEENTGIEVPNEFIIVNSPEQADLLITNKTAAGPCRRDRLFLRPKNLVVGIGCNSGASAEEIENTVRNILADNNLSFLSVHSFATIDRKKDEPGLVAFAEKNGFELQIFTPEELNTVSGISTSKAVFKATGANAVAEPAAVLASGNNALLVPKQKSGNVTVAVAQWNSKLKTQNSKLGFRAGKIYAVGTGPGSAEHITPYAQEAIRKCDIVVGYAAYLDLIPGLTKGKEIYSTGMTKETERCQKAVELALTGKTVAVISGGDPGIYAMAGLVFELLKAEEERRQGTEMRGNGYMKNSQRPLPEVEVVPGISALNACASRLGAPLMHDFACVSLSDRLTPWELIEKRLNAAAMTDFVIVLYNPKSMGRPEHIRVARDIILRHRSIETPVGIVKGAMRGNETVNLTTLGEMLACDIDMQTTVIIGNSKTLVWDNSMITPRGYRLG